MAAAATAAVDTCQQTGLHSPVVSGSEGTDASSPRTSDPGALTPRKNKRKMTEPKKRADVNVKRIRSDSAPDSPVCVIQDNNDNEISIDNIRKGDMVKHNIYKGDIEKRNILKGDLGKQSIHKGDRERRPTERKERSERNRAKSSRSAVNKVPLNIPVVPMPIVIKPEVGDISHSPAYAPHLVDIPGRSLGRIPASGSRNQSPEDLSNFRAPIPGSATRNDANIPRNGNNFYSNNEVEDLSDRDANGRRQRKNYKNMTRERRIEANARERTRVHTISAAFENLRRAVPSYSYNQRLSKLAILRIASSYILSLTKLADLDVEKSSQTDISFSQCVDLCTKTIQTEGRAKKRH